MQAGTGVRPHFSCTVCHNQYDGLYEFKNHLESQEHELAYGIRLRNSMVGSYFCNCCHICVNTLLIWKSHIMGTKHMKIACAFSMAYSNFDFDKPAKIKDVGVLDQNVVVPDSRSNGRVLVRPLDPDTVVIGVTDMEYTGPGLYHCNLCNDPFNEGNKAQHLCSTRHRCNVFERWDMALYDEAISARKVGKPEYTVRCESIASEIFPVEQQVLSPDKKLLYDRLMGTSQVLDDQYYAEELARGGPGPKVDNRQNAYDSQGPRGSRAHDRQVQQDRYGPPDDHPSRSRYHDNQYPGYHDQMLDGEEPAKHSLELHASLRPRAASRHSTTPEQTGRKRYLVRDSPLRDTDHKDKRHRVGTLRKRGNSECSKKNGEPLKFLTKEQIAKREKQVMYGKVTEGYQNYKSIVPKNMRHIRDPATPQKDYPYSKRCWDGLVRSWRRKLHEWDNPSVALNLRGAYTKNNKDLKDSGLINKSGELVMFTTSDICRDYSGTTCEREDS